MKRQLTALVIAAVAITPAFAQYTIDDGVTENAIGVTPPSSFLWANNFTVTAGSEVITGVQVAFGWTGFPQPQMNGMTVNVFVMRANPDGTPMQGGLLTSMLGVIANEGTDTFVNFNTVDQTLNVGDRFLVGVVFDTPVGVGLLYPAGMDQTAPLPMRSYAAYLSGAGNSIDPNNINAVPAGQRGYIEAFGISGNWTVRATAAPVPEPGTMLALSIGIVALARKRRKSA